MKKITFLILICIIHFHVLGQDTQKKILKNLSSTVSIFLDSNTKTGSGFIIEDGKVVTNLHVIEGHNNGYVVVNGTDIKHKIAGFFDYDEHTDLAILSVPSLKGSHLTLSNEEPKTGDKIFALKASVAASKTVFEGIINYISDSSISGVISTSVTLDFGDSGSALVDSKGQVKGIFSGSFFGYTNRNRGSIAVNVSFLKKILAKKNTIRKDLNIIKGSIHYIKKSNLKAKIKDYEGAISDLNKGIELNPNIFMTYFNRANVKFELNDTKGCIDDCNKCLDILPDFASAYNLRGLAKLKAKDSNGALKDFNKSIHIYKHFALAYNNRGLAKVSQKNLKAAIKDFDKAIQIDSTNNLFYGSRGIYKYFSGLKKEGCKDLQRAKELGFVGVQKIINQFCN